MRLLLLLMLEGLRFRWVVDSKGNCKGVACQADWHDNEGMGWLQKFDDVKTCVCMLLVSSSMHSVAENAHMQVDGNLVAKRQDGFPYCEYSTYHAALVFIQCCQLLQVPVNGQHCSNA
jgi:hypothetical protein